MASLSQYIQTNYPSPSDGDEFLWGGVRYSYDATPGIWRGSLPDPDAQQDVQTGTQPTNPITGELWYDPSENRLKIYNGTSFVDTNPPPSAAELRASSTVAVQNSGTQVEGSAATLNFGTGLTAEMSATGEATINSSIPAIPDALPMTVQNYALRVPTSGSPTWVTTDMAATTVGLGSLSNVVAPTDAATGTIISKTSTNYAAQTPAQLGLAEAATVTALTTRVTTLEGLDTLGELTDVSSTTPTNGQVLTYNTTNSMWEPAAAPAGSGSNTVSISDMGRTITINSVDTSIPVITAAALSGSTLNLTTNGSVADLSVDLASISGANPQVATNQTDIAALTTRVTTLEDGIPTQVVVKDDGTTINSVTDEFDFTGLGVTVSNTGAGRVAVNIPGTNTSAAVEQTNFDKSSERANSTQFHINGGDNGGKFRIIMKNNNATTARNIRYSFSTPADPADNVAAGVSYGDLPGLWDSDAEQFVFFPSGSNGQTVWAPNAFTSLAARNIIQLEIDVQPNGRVNFATSNADVLWNVASIGGFVNPAAAPSTPPAGTDTTPGPSYATGTEAVPPLRGPFYIKRGVGHYNMTWALAGGDSIRLDQIMGGTGSVQTGGRDFYRPADTSENQGLWIVAYRGASRSTSTNIGWGVVMPGSSGDTSTQTDINTINASIMSNSIESANMSFYNTTGETITSPDQMGNGRFQAAPLDTYGPNLGAFGDAQAFTSASGSLDWHNSQSCHFYIPGSSPSMAVELRRGTLRATRQSPANSNAKLSIYELYFQIYTPS